MEKTQKKSTKFVKIDLPKKNHLKSSQFNLIHQNQMHKQENEFLTREKNKYEMKSLTIQTVIFLFS